MGERAQPRILGSARKHGVNDTDILHAYRNPIRLYDAGNGFAMLIGPAASGMFIEVGVVDADDGPVIVHAMSARQKFLRRG
jgi:hypothetical protein